MKTIVTFALLSFSLALGCGGEKQLESLEALRGKDAKTAEKIEKLVEKMHSPDPDVSLGAAQKLGKIGKPAVPILIELLRDENPINPAPSGVLRNSPERSSVKAMASGWRGTKRSGEREKGLRG